MATLRINANQSAYADQYSPNTVFTGSELITAETYNGQTRDNIKCSFIGFPYQAVAKKNIKSIDIYVYLISQVRVSGNYDEFGVSVLSEAVSASNFNYKTATNLKKNQQPGSGYGHSNGAYIPMLYTGLSTSALLNILKYGIVTWVGAGYGSHTGTAIRKIGSSSNANRPYLNVTYEDVKPYGSNFSPSSGGFVDRTKEIKFQWLMGLASNDTIEQIFPQKALFRWKKSDETNYTEITVNSAQNSSWMSYTMPANTLPSGNIQWCVLIQTNDGVWGAASAWQTVVTVDAISSAIAISPADTYIDKSVENLFSWQHVISTGTPSTKSELQYSFDLSTWSALALVIGPKVSTSIPKNMLPTGRIFWRVRTYNVDGVAGSWSNSLAIVVRGAPEAPSIVNVSNAARPAIKWQSREQQAYQLKILNQSLEEIIDTGEVYGVAKEYHLKEYLDDGGYAVQIRIKSSYGLWSAWSQLGFQISTTKPSPPLFFCVPGNGYVSFIVNNASAYSALYLLRDNIPIAKIGDKYIDYTGLGQHSYTLRGVSASDSFADSAPQLINCKIERGVLLSAADNFSQMIPIYLRRDERPRLTGTKEIPGKSLYFSGRKYPSYEFSEFSNETYEITFSFKSRVHWQAFLSLIEKRKAILYRDFLGNKFYGVISTSTFEQDAFSVDFNATISKIDYAEKIAYT